MSCHRKSFQNFYVKIPELGELISYSPKIPHIVCYFKKKEQVLIKKRKYLVINLYPVIVFWQIFVVNINIYAVSVCWSFRFSVFTYQRSLNFLSADAFAYGNTSNKQLMIFKLSNIFCPAPFLQLKTSPQKLSALSSSSRPFEAKFTKQLLASRNWRWPLVTKKTNCYWLINKWCNVKIPA